MRSLGLWPSLLALLLTVGCATVGQEKLLDQSDEATLRATSYSAPKGTATVFLMRERAILQNLLLTPIPPAYMAVNDTIVSSLPVGAFIPLALPPGEHRFTRMVVAKDVPFAWYKINRHDATLSFEADKTYFIASVNTLSDTPIRSLSEPEGRQTLESLQLGREIINGKSTSAFLSQFETAEQRLASNTQRARAPVDSTAVSTSATPDSGAWLEGIATVLLIALALSAGQATAQPTTPPLPYRPVPAITAPYSPPAVAALPQRASPPLAALPQSAADVLWSGRSAEFRDRNTGVRYTVEDGRVTGTDGSRYKVIGNQLLSEGGQWYQVIGNTLYSAAGSQCRISDQSISCRSR